MQSTLSQTTGTCWKRDLTNNPYCAPRRCSTWTTSYLKASWDFNRSSILSASSGCQEKTACRGTVEGSARRQFHNERQRDWLTAISSKPEYFSREAPSTRSFESVHNVHTVTWLPRSASWRIRLNERTRTRLGI